MNEKLLKIKKMLDADPKFLLEQCKNGKIEIVKALLLELRDSLDLTSYIEYRDNNDAFKGYTVLTHACEKGHTEIVQLLIKAGANVNAKAGNWVTPLFSTVWNKSNDPHIIDILIKAGANIEERAYYSHTPLLSATYYSYLLGMKILLENGACFNSCLTKCGPDGDTSVINDTALHLAARRGYKEGVKLLLEYGASIKMKNNEGKTAEQVARENRHIEVADFIPVYYRQLKRKVPAIDREISELKHEINELREWRKKSDDLAKFSAERNIGMERIEKACKYYASGKAAFYQKDITNAITFFQQAKDKYRDALDVPGIDQKDKARIESRLTKLKNPEGKYSPMKLTK